MGNQSLMQTVLIVMLLACGYLYLLQRVYRNASNRNIFPLLAIVLLLIYAAISAGLVAVLSRLGSMEFVFLALLMLFACLMIMLMILYLFSHFREINKGATVIFLFYALAVGYITIFGRHGDNDTSIFVGFRSIEKAIQRQSFEPLQHMLLNAVMFVPLGFLFCMIHPGHVDRLFYVLPVCLMLTVTIESTQLLLRWGQCDLEDIVANTLGGVIGFGIYRLFHLRRRREDGYE